MAVPDRITQKRTWPAPTPTDYIERHDGALVATSTIDSEDLKFMAAEEDSMGRHATAAKLRDLARTELSVRRSITRHP